ncbi:hypothetical protein [Paludisphaera mucosa]|uniref:Tetratricopeptide repeat protein n=1 Tax=Paludisphaera mucosa TaxID=3030827 RepID=A0ABT6FIV4_9BACT|nr:hypothetical protein [Paludisphaera mucosa]MDG3007518.1 hypothetical protein [Paludisphaera mucosa]
MAEYLVTGRDSAGRSATERIEAGSADDAVRIAREARGLDEVVLHTDDVGALYSRQAAVAEVVSPRDYLRFRDLPAPIAGFLVVSKAIYRRSRGLILLAAAVLAYRRWRGWPWTAIDWLQAFVVIWPMIFAAAAQLLRERAGRYGKLIEAVAWGRREDALRAADGLKGSRVPPEELAFRRAQALAGLGRLDEALAVIATYGDGEAMAGWLYNGRLPEIYNAAKRPDDSRTALERAAELAPGNPSILLDLGGFEIRHGRNPRRARELPARAREHALSDVLTPFALALEGKILRDEGRPREAIPLLVDARRRLSALRHASPLVGGAVDYLDADLALALAAAGDVDAALRHARRALPRLQALKGVDILDRLRSALGPDVEG